MDGAFEVAMEVCTRDRRVCFVFAMLCSAEIGIEPSNHPRRPMAASSSKLKVKTIVRLRPSFDHPDDGIYIEHDTISVVNPQEPETPFRFQFASVHGPDASQEDVYSRDVQGLVSSVWKGMVSQEYQ